MKLHMSSQKFDADIKLLNFIQKKADKLDLFHDRIINGEVFLRINKDKEKRNKVVEMKLNVPGKTLFSKQHALSFEAATDSAIEALRRQLKKVKTKPV